MFKGLAAAAAVCATLAMPVHAACWNEAEVSAANVRELQSMLMVAALRCQVAGYPMMAEYNNFVVANRKAIGSLNDKLKSHFIRSMGPVAGQRGYDSFTTSMANGYGAASSGAEVCNTALTIAREGALMADSIEGLMLLADRQGLTAKLPEGVCGNVAPMIASAAGATADIARR